MKNKLSILIFGILWMGSALSSFAQREPIDSNNYNYQSNVQTNDVSQQAPNNAKQKKSHNKYFTILTEVTGNIGWDTRSLEPYFGEDIWVDSLGSSVSANVIFKFIDHLYLKIGYSHYFNSNVSIRDSFWSYKDEYVDGLFSMGYLNFAGGVTFSNVYFGVGGLFPFTDSLAYTDGTSSGQNIANTYWNQGIYIESGYHIPIMKRISLKLGLQWIYFLSHRNSALIGDVPHGGTFKESNGDSLGIEFGIIIKLL